MVSDQEIQKGVETVLRQSDPSAVTTLNGVVQQLEANLGLDLSHKAGFIRDHINFLLRSHPTAQTTATASANATQPLQPQALHLPQKDHFALQHQAQFQQFPPHFALHQPQPQVFSQDLNFQQPPPSQHAPQQHQQLQQATKPQAFSQNAASAPPATPRESAPTGAKRRGGPGGLNKVCGVSPELQVIVGEPALPRTEIVKQLWAYIRKNNLQDPSNKRKIICDDALRVVFETDCTDMFKMNKLLAKHIIPLEPTKESSQAKRAKVDVESKNESTEPGQSVVVISEALAKFLGTVDREMTQMDVSRRIREYIKVNHLEDPLNSMVIMCDAKLQELLGCESISAVGVEEMLAHHLFKPS
uniref:Brg-1 associated factor n=1 Tax=Rhizophora mucronata TaxID=61149 RepID=A0A2P2LB18_RHIMU